MKKSLNGLQKAIKVFNIYYILGSSRNEYGFRTNV